MKRRKASQTLILLLLLVILTSETTIRPVRASGFIYIRSDGSIDPSTAPILRNGYVYTLIDDIEGSIVIEKNNTIVDGAGHVLQGAGSWETGLDLSGTANVTVSNMEVEAFDYGINLYLSNNDTVSGMSITSTSLEGIYLYSSSNSNIVRNNISTNDGDGIYLFSSSSNRILENNIASNTWGISSYYSSADSIFHNNFLSNSQQANLMESADFWNNTYPSGGNYWNDYVGTDHMCGPRQDNQGSDGMGDTPYTIDTNNKDNYPLINPWTPPSGHDVAVISVVPSKVVIGQGFIGNITVYGANKGEYPDNFNVTLYANASQIASNAVRMESGSVVTITFSWNTTGVSDSSNGISAYVWPVLGETNTANNNFTGGHVIVTIPGDINGDFKVGLQDLVLLALAYGTTPKSGGVPGVARAWNPNADIDNNGVVGLPDLVHMALHYGQHYP